MVPTNSINSRKRTSTPGAKPRAGAAEENKNLKNQEKQRGIDIKSPASARASAALGASPPSCWARVKKVVFFPLRLLPKFRTVVLTMIMAFLVAIAAFLVLQSYPHIYPPAAASLSTGFDDLVYQIDNLGNVTKHWFDDFAQTLPNRTAQMTARFSELTSEASYQKFSSFAMDALSTVSGVASEAFLKGSIFANEALSQLASLKVSEGLWKIVGLTSAFIVSAAALWWGLKWLCSRRKAA